ncbi:MAG: NAD(P)/FAD-dependent oxidoreductase, partial [Planctomyces sp.]
MSDRIRIVILGGGFGGVYTAMHLERLLRRDSRVEIALVNRENYFVFQPMLAEVVSGNIGLLDTVSPISRLIPRCRLYVREVESVDLEARSVTLAPGFRPQPLVLQYDHLVLAAGTVTDFRGMTGLQQHAMPFKTLADAVRLRNHLINVLHEADIESDEMRRQQLLTFVVAGGGFSGVEVAAEMNDFLRAAAARLHTDLSREVRVLLVHSGQRILERELSESLGLYAQKILQGRGVE